MLKLKDIVKLMNDFFNQKIQEFYRAFELIFLLNTFLLLFWLIKKT